jgi:hypothetical protein
LLELLDPPPQDRAATITSQKSVKPLSRSGYGLFSGENVSPRKSPVVASKVSLKVTKPASRERTGPSPGKLLA